MSYDYSENILVQESAGNFLRDELGWDVQFADNTEVHGENGTFGRKSHREPKGVERGESKQISFRNPLALTYLPGFPQSRKSGRFPLFFRVRGNPLYLTSSFDFAEIFGEVFFTAAAFPPAFRVRTASGIPLSAYH